MRESVTDVYNVSRIAQPFGSGVMCPETRNPSEAALCVSESRNPSEAALCVSESRNPSEAERRVRKYLYYGPSVSAGERLR